MTKKKEISKEPQRVLTDFWEYLKDTDLPENERIIINPTHNFELLKKIRESIYLTKKKIFIGQRNLSKLNTNDFEIEQFYILWLKNEIDIIKVWLSNNQNTSSNIIEINKYNDFVNNEIIKASKPPLTDIEKKVVFEKILPYGLYYENETDISRINKKIHALKTDTFKTNEDFEKAIKSLLHSNNLGLVSRIKSLSNVDFIEALNVQCNLYNYHNPINIVSWLEYTKHLIMEGKGLHFTKVNDMTKENAFINWYNEKIKEINEHTKNSLISPDIIRKNEIAMKLIGLIGNHNHSNTIQPVYYYINDVLNEYNITPIEAKEIVLQMKGSVSPLWNKNVIPFIVEHLKQIEPINDTQQSTKETKSIENIELEKFDSNNWNDKCFDLFNYLCDNYKKKAKTQKFTNIWFYLEYDTTNDYVFNFTKDDYKLFITDNLKFDFSKAKMNKPNNYEAQLIILNNHYTVYCNKLKALK